MLLLLQLNPQTVLRLVPSINILDTNWVNKVVPALNNIDPDYLVAVIEAIAPRLPTINPDQIVALLPAIGTISVSTWQKLIELLNKLTPAQVGASLHFRLLLRPCSPQGTCSLPHAMVLVSISAVALLGHRVQHSAKLQCLDTAWL